MSIFTLPPYAVIYICFVAVVLGLAMGSAMNCLAMRLVDGRKWSGSNRSVCMSCGHVLVVRDLVPVFSWLALKGKCRYCGEKVSPRYPLTEGFMGLVCLSLVLRFGLTLDTLTATVLCCCLFCLSLVDLDTQIIPNRFLIIPAVLRIGQILFESGLHGLLHGVIPALVLGGGVLILALIMDKVLKKDSMGGGDIKLFAMLGLFFTLPEGLLLVVAACIFGLIMAVVFMKVKPNTAFPFAPALSFAAWVILLAGEPIVHWYSHLFY